MRPAAAPLAVSPLLATVAALCANLVGIGLARFAYTPLIPALIEAHWFSPSAAAYLGAANLAGYLAGALGARRIAASTDVASALRGAMAVTVASLVACAAPLGFEWFFLWRFTSGCTGGVLMALAAPSVMPVIPPSRRGLAGGAIFTGIGLGIAASGTFVPLLLRWGLVTAWLGLAGAAAIATALAWRAWPAATPAAPARQPQPTFGRSSRALRALYVEYALNAAGLVPHMVFLVDFVVRGLRRGAAAGSLFWIAFGAGAVGGPLVSGHLGDRIGFQRALRLALALQALCVALPVATAATGPLLFSSMVVGGFVLGVVAITNGRTRELVAGDVAAQTAAWGRCTTAFAIGQAIAAYGFSYLFAHVDNAYPALFALAAAALLLALVIDLSVGMATRRAAVLR